MKAFLAGLFFLVLHADGQADVVKADWQFAKEQDDVRVYTGEVQGSKFLAFQAMVEIKAPVEAVLEAIADHASYPQWYDNCKSTELLEMRSPNQAVVRIVIKTPFPLANRDAINQVTINRVDGGAVVDLRSLPNATASVRGLVRMEQASGTWVLEESADATRVIHTYHADPKASVPAWMVNRFVVDGPLRSLSALRKRLESS